MAAVDTDGDGVAEEGVIGIDRNVDAGANFIFNGGSFYAPFILANGAPLDITELEALIAEEDDGPLVDGDVIGYGSVGFNPDGTDHVRTLGDNVFGFEDLLGGGDADFNDAVVGLNITPFVEEVAA